MSGTTINKLRWTTITCLCAYESVCEKENKKVTKKRVDRFTEMKTAKELRVKYPR